MHWPWKQPDPPPSPVPDHLLERARHERERAQAIIEFFLPQIDPNDTFGAGAGGERGEGEPWTP